MKKFLRQIRQADEPVRKRWLIIFSAIAAIVITAVWLVYFNALLVTVNPPADQQLAANQPATAADAFKTGLSLAKKKVMLGLTNSYLFFKEKLSRRHKFVVSRTNQNFIWDDLEKLPPQPLP